MSWQLFVRAAAEADLENLEEADKQDLVSELFNWVDSGPPRDTLRNVLGVEMFDDDTPSGFRVTYVVDDDNQRIFVVRIRSILEVAEVARQLFRSTTSSTCRSGAVRTSNSSAQRGQSVPGSCRATTQRSL